MDLTNIFLTTSGASATTSGVAIVKTGLPTVGKVALIIHSGRSGDIRLQNSSGILEDGKFIPIASAAGGDDSIVIYFDGIGSMPTHIAGTSGTVSVSYTVAMVR